MKKHLEAAEGLSKIPHEELLTSLEDIMEDDPLLTQAVLARLPFSDIDQIPHALQKPLTELLEMLLGVESVIEGSAGEYKVSIERIDMDMESNEWEFTRTCLTFDIRFKYRKEPSFYYGEIHGIRFNYYFSNHHLDMPRENLIEELLRIAQSVWTQSKPHISLGKLSVTALDKTMRTVGGIY